MKCRKLVGVTAETSKAGFSLPCGVALLQRACTGSLAWLLCIRVGDCRAV